MVRVFTDLQSFEEFNGNVDDYEEFIKDEKFILVWDEDLDETILLVNGTMYFVIGGYDEIQFEKMDCVEDMYYRRKYGLAG